MITYLQSINPITIAKKVPKRTRDAFDSLLDNPEILRVKETLSKSSPELKSFDITNHLGINFLELPILKNEQLLLILKSTPGCNLHMGKVESIIDNIMLFQVFNCCLNQKIGKVEEPPIFVYLSGKQSILAELTTYPTNDLSVIVMPLKTSKKRLIDWINRNWELIQQSNRHLPKFSLDQLPKNIAIGKEIADLRDGGLTFSQITTKLSDQYPNDDRLLDESHVKTMYDRYKKFVVNGIKSLVSIKSLKGNTKT